MNQAISSWSLRPLYKALQNNHFQSVLLKQTTRTFSMSNKTQQPKIVKISELSTDEAKWIEFKKIEV